MTNIYQSPIARLPVPRLRQTGFLESDQYDDGGKAKFWPGVLPGLEKYYIYPKARKLAIRDQGYLICEKPVGLPHMAILHIIEFE
jgi:hypothetical protein